MKFIKYNVQIFKAWFIYILLGKKVSKEAIELLKSYYNATKREKRLIDRIKKRI